MRFQRIIRSLVTGLAGIVCGWVVLSVGTPLAYAQTVQYGFSMDQAFSNNPYAGGGTRLINGGWTNLPWSNPPGWPLQGTNNNMWENKQYIQNATGSTQTVQSGQSFSISPPSNIEDVCQASNYGTRGYWRGLMVIVNSSNNEAWSWHPPGGNWYGWGSGVNSEAGYCTPGQNYGAAPTFYVTAPQVSTTTTYYADFFAEEAQYTSSADTTVDGDISGVVVPITVEAAPTPTPTAQPSATLSASPTRLTTGSATTLTATPANVPSGDFLQITGTNGFNQTGSSSTFVTTDTEYSPTTVTYTVYVNNSAGQHVYTGNTQTVTWTAASSGGGTSGGVTVSLSASPTRLTTGNATTLTATASENVGPTPYFINILDLTTGAVVTSCGTGSTCTGTVTEYQATTQTFQADIGPVDAQPSASGVVATSDQPQVTWTAPVVTQPSVTIHLADTETPMTVGQSSTLVATASQPFSNAYLAGIVPISGGVPVYTTGGSQYAPANAGTSYDWVVSSNQAGSETFQLRWAVNGSGDVIDSNDVTVTWTAPPTVGLSVVTPRYVGQATTLTATANENVGSTLDSINIVDLTTGTVVASCDTGSTCSGTLTENQATTQTFQADIGPADATPTASGVQSTSHTHAVVWYQPAVSLTDSASQRIVGQAVTLTATGTHVPPGDAIQITGTDGLSHTASPNATVDTTTDTQSVPTTVTYTATIVDSAGHQVATSSPVSVTWTAPAVSNTGCVPYRPGYEYIHGQATYNPQACPVPTPVNF